MARASALGVERSCTILLDCLACGALSAGQPMAGYSPLLPAASEELAATEQGNAPFVIFFNLDSTPGARFNDNQFAAFAIAGKSALGETETWYAIGLSRSVVSLPAIRKLNRSRRLVSRLPPSLWSESTLRQRFRPHRLFPGASTPEFRVEPLSRSISQSKTKIPRPLL